MHWVGQASADLVDCWPGWPAGLHESFNSPEPRPQICGPSIRCSQLSLNIEDNVLQASADQDIIVTHVDTTYNDWNQLSKTLSTSPDSYLTATDRLYSYFQAKSFFEQVAPAATVALAYSGQLNDELIQQYRSAVVACPIVELMQLFAATVTSVWPDRRYVATHNHPDVHSDHRLVEGWCGFLSPVAVQPQQHPRSLSPWSAVHAAIWLFHVML